MRNPSEKYFPLIEKHLRSNLTALAFCARHGINIKTLYYWKKKFLLQSSKVPSKRGFTALSIMDPVKETEVSIHYPDGTRLSFAGNADANMIKQFLPVFNS